MITSNNITAENDTFNALKKWEFNKIDEALTKNAEVNGGKEGVDRLLKESCWTLEEFTDEMKKRWISELK